jgi:type IV pilus assembly protein PilW
MISTKSTSIQKLRRHQRGAGLIEIMVAMLLMAIMFNGLIDMFLSSRATFSATDNLSRLQENGRTAIDLLSRGLRRSGYLGGNSDIGNIRGTLGISTTATTCITNTNVWARMIGQGVYGLNDTKVGYACIDDTYLRGDILTLRYASPWTVETADFADTRVYLRSSLFKGRVFLGADEADLLNDVDEQPKAQHQLLAYSYYVADTGRTCNGAAVPALFREAADVNNLPVAEELIEGVENIQFQYNVGDQYVDADNVADWDSVLSVKLWVLVRSACPETGYSDVRTYVLSDVTPDYAPADNYRRHLYTTVVALRN